MSKSNLVLILAVAAIVFSFLAFGTSRADAHCDTMGGPVVKDAEVALEKKDVTPVLKWVSKEKEEEVRAAFDVAIAERAKNPEAKEKADMKFFETLARIHREGEGEPFTGMKPADAIEPIELEADQALETGLVDNLTGEMSGHLTNSVKEKFDRALEKRKHKDESVEAGREYVEAYVQYLHYIEGVHKAISGKNGHPHKESEEALQEEHKAE